MITEGITAMITFFHRVQVWDRSKRDFFGDQGVEFVEVQDHHRHDGPKLDHDVEHVDKLLGFVELNKLIDKDQVTGRTDR